jgi:hypothetical protein
MNTGISLTAMATELERRVQSRHDYIAPSPKILATITLPPPTDPKRTITRPTPALDLGPSGVFGVQPHAHQQLAQYAGIPKQYYDRMIVEEPQLWAQNVNAWLGRKPEEKRMVRTLDGGVRAILSDRYRPLDDFDLAHAVLPVLTKVGAEIRSTALTETKLYIKATLPGLRAPITHSVRGAILKQDDIIEGGVEISNSEVGSSRLSVAFWYFALICTNGMKGDRVIGRMHVGKRAELDIEEAAEYFTDTTRKADDKAFFMKVRDVVEAAFSRERFFAAVARMDDAAQVTLKAKKVEEIVEVQLRRGNLFTEEMADRVRGNLIEGRDLTVWGLANAVTAAANEEEDYETASALEALGGDIIELPQSEWKELAA